MSYVETSDGGKQCGDGISSSLGQTADELTISSCTDSDLYGRCMIVCVNVLCVPLLIFFSYDNIFFKKDFTWNVCDRFGTLLLKLITVGCKFTQFKIFLHSSVKKTTTTNIFYVCH